jgi:hypothetical protein
LPFDFGKPTGNMGVLWLKLVCLMKGCCCFVEFPLHQARISMCKCLEREILAGLALWLDGSDAPSVPTRYDPPYTHDDGQYHDDVSHVVLSFVAYLHPAIADDVIAVAPFELYHLSLILATKVNNKLDKFGQSDKISEYFTHVAILE